LRRRYEHFPGSSKASSRSGATTFWHGGLHLAPPKSGILHAPTARSSLFASIRIPCVRTNRSDPQTSSHAPRDRCCSHTARSRRKREGELVLVCAETS